MWKNRSYLNIVSVSVAIIFTHALKISLLYYWFCTPERVSNQEITTCYGGPDIQNTQKIQGHNQHQVQALTLILCTCSFVSCRFLFKVENVLLTVFALSLSKQGNIDYIKVCALNCFNHCVWLVGWQKKLIKLEIQWNFSKSVVFI